MCSRYWATLWLQWSHLMRVTAAEGGCGLWVRPFQPWLTHNWFSWICCAVQHITLAGQEEAVHNIASIKLSSFFSHFCFEKPHHSLFRLTWVAHHSIIYRTQDKQLEPLIINAGKNKSGKFLRICTVRREFKTFQNVHHMQMSALADLSHAVCWFSDSKGGRDWKLRSRWAALWRVAKCVRQNKQTARNDSTTVIIKVLNTSRFRCVFSVIADSIVKHQ